ncbi:cell division protein ZapA [uncultured Desulfuromonas sp.]|uniref:cell division protein ZapA n=1 Tax=uncultured Desulfuromonas sp. TaxID=181013 RepID=UPI002AAAD394|nr:cell division protein ZapA [uncultured Desulfuromonas sp.]
MKQSVRVTILGQDFSIRSTCSVEEVQKVAAYVDARIAEVMAAGATADTLGATVLALMNVAGLYLESLRELERAQSAMSQSLQTLDDKLSSALPE